MRPRFPFALGHHGSRFHVKPVDDHFRPRTLLPMVSVSAFAISYPEKQRRRSNAALVIGDGGDGAAAAFPRGNGADQKSSHNHSGRFHVETQLVRLMCCVGLAIPSWLPKNPAVPRGTDVSVPLWLNLRFPLLVLHSSTFVIFLRLDGLPMTLEGNPNRAAHQLI